MKLRLIHSTTLQGDIVTKYKQLYGDDRVVYTAFAQKSGDVRLQKEVNGKSQRLTKDEMSALSQRFVLNSKVAAMSEYQKISPAKKLGGTQYRKHGWGDFLVFTHSDPKLLAQELASL